MRQWKGVAAGAGYFSDFHFDAWRRMPNVRISAVCDLDCAASDRVARRYHIARQYVSYEQMLDQEQPDFVDIITRPDSHLALVTAAAQRGIPVICQKPLAPTYDEAKELVTVASEAGIPLMVHENFRFQPWYRLIKSQLNAGRIGNRLHSIAFRCRTGDGWQIDAYLDRQPYFRDMPRFLIFETGVHFVDTFRFLAGEVTSVYANQRTWNSAVTGEDAATVMFEFESGATAVWDGNRYNEPLTNNPRLTFGEALIEGNEGALWLNSDGMVSLKLLGQPVCSLDYTLPTEGFAGDCVLATQQHFIDCLDRGEVFETSGDSYLKSLGVVEAIYESAAQGLPIRRFRGGLDARR